MNHIVIIGFMGSGKTRVGKRLAKAVQNLIEQKDRAAGLAERGRAFCRETFNQEASMDRLCELLWPENAAGM